MIENHVCESWHRRKGIDIRIYDEMMCAGYELGQRDACQVSGLDEAFYKIRRREMISSFLAKEVNLD